MLTPLDILHKLRAAFVEIDVEEQPEGFFALLCVIDNRTGETHVMNVANVTNNVMSIAVPSDKLLFGAACLTRVTHEMICGDIDFK